ncbi:MAG: TonB-dependent receptor [Pedobacter sp.]
MRLTTSLITVLCFITSSLLAQTQFGLKGVAIDSASQTKLDQATISIITARDSILQTFVYADKGRFEIKNIPPGNYLLMISYPEFADYVEHFTLDDKQPMKDFGTINMILRSKLLQEVIIKARMASIKMKGDTTEFNAAAFETQKNAKVEDLIKQFPGMKTNRNGEIVFQGTVVEKILLDGEEFFGDDPALITKNIRADMVETVQVYDAKSDEAKRTGIEDGVKIKTINIQLREDKKKGIFGKTEAGYGTDDYYTAQAAINKFNEKQKIAAYGNFGNTGRVGLSGDDNNKFGVGGTNMGFRQGTGLPQARDGGIAFINKWNKDKESINANVKAGSLILDFSSNTLTQNTLPGNFNLTNRNSTSRQELINQSIGAIYTKKLDSTSELSIDITGANSSNSFERLSDSKTSRGNGITLNTGTNLSSSENNNQSFYFRSNYNKRFNKKGRSLTLKSSAVLSGSDSETFLNATLDYFDSQGMPDSSNVVDQFKPSKDTRSNYSAGINFTEALFEHLNLNVGYSLQGAINDVKNLSYNKSTANTYDLLDPLFSNHLRTQNTTNDFQLNMAYVKPKVSINVVGGYSNVDFNQNNKLGNTTIKRNFNNWSPAVYLWHELSKGTSVNLNYNGNTRQPYAEQLFTVAQNTDPLNISVGNPLLRPSFTNYLFFKYYKYQPTLDRGINFNTSISNTYNGIVQNRSTDSSGVNTYSWANLKNKQPNTWSMYSEVYGHIPKIDFIASISFEASSSVSYNYINAELNKMTTTTYSPGLSVWKNKVNYRASFDLGPNYKVSTSSLQSQNNNSYGLTSRLSLYTKLPFQFFIGSDVNYSYTGKSEVFNKSFDQTLITAYLGRSFFKEEGLKFTITGNDLLNQNTGYRRTQDDGMFQESRNATIRRYFMIAAIWDFSKFGKSQQPQQP